MDINDIIDSLNRSPRFGRPDFGYTVVITEQFANEIVKTLKKIENKPRKRKTLHLNNTVGAQPQ